MTVSSASGNTNPMSISDIREKNVLGEPLKPCCFDPLTGFERDGFCRTGPMDRGNHSICAIMTKAFLEFSKERGNDLSSPNLAAGFPGLKPGDKWCMCAGRWQEAFEAGVAPPVELSSCHQSALEEVSLYDLRTMQLQ